MFLLHPLDYKPKFREALNAPDPLAPLIKEVCPGVFVFDAFSRGFCETILKTVSKHPSEAPNSMNKYGQVLADIGMSTLNTGLLKDVVKPLVRRFYPSIKLKSTHGFIVNYDTKKQGSLDLHYDESVVTLNICLGRKFKGGKLLFRTDPERGQKAGAILTTVEHRVGQAVLHLGEHMHEAQRITSGERSNLILWCS